MMDSQTIEIRYEVGCLVGCGPLVDNAQSPPDFECVIAQFYPRIYRAALLMTGTTWDAEDLAQETFLHAMKAWHRFAGRSRVETWLYAILMNQHRKTLRNRGRAWRRALDWFLFRRTFQTEPQRPDEPLRMREWEETLWSAVAQLPTGQQHAVVLRYAQGLPYEQIAEVLGCPLGTVKSRLHNALATLRKELGEGVLEVAVAGQ